MKFDSACSRRALLQGLGIAAVGSWIGACISQPGSSLSSASGSMCGSNLCIDLTDPANQALTMVDGALLVDAPNDTLVVIRSSETEVVVLTAICTHAMCTVDFVPASQLLKCPCHGSEYDETGRVVRGPARRALRVYPATLSGNTITVTLA